MLRRIVQFSRNQGAATREGEETGQRLAPYRMISASGALVPPGPQAEPLPATGNVAVNLQHPPGLYGGEEGVLAHNLFETDDRLVSLERPESPVAVTALDYAEDSSVDLKGPLLIAALLLLALDTLAVLWMGGKLKARRFSARKAGAAVPVLAALTLAAGLMAADSAFAPGSEPR